MVAVGGSDARAARARARCESSSAGRRSSTIDPDEVVALGAGIQAGILTGGRRDMLLLDVVPLSLGIETMGGVFTRLIDRNTTIPASHMETFTTAVDNQTSVDVHVLQGERELATDNRSLARFTIPDRAAARRRAARRGDVPGRRQRHPVRDGDAISAPARERSVEVKPSYGLTDDEIERMLEESIDLAEEDVAAAPAARGARRGGDHPARHARRRSRSTPTRLEPGEAERIQAAIAALDGRARRARTTCRIRELYDELSTSHRAVRPSHHGSRVDARRSVSRRSRSCDDARTLTWDDAGGHRGAARRAASRCRSADACASPICTAGSCELPDFADDPQASSEGKLERIQMAWVETRED